MRGGGEVRMPEQEASLLACGELLPCAVGALAETSAPYRTEQL
jgi:hypothetical protein